MISLFCCNILVLVLDNASATGAGNFTWEPKESVQNYLTNVVGLGDSERAKESCKYSAKPLPYDGSLLPRASL